MADYTPSSGSIITPHRSPWGNFPVRHFPENNGSSFKLGNIVMASTYASTASGRIEEMSSLSTRIVGVAAAAASSVVTTQIPVWEANPMVEFKGVAKGTIGSTLVSVCFSLAYDSTLGIDYVDLANSSAADQRVVITEIVSGADGDTNGIVAFKFLQWDGLATSTGRGPNLAYYR